MTENTIDPDTIINSLKKKSKTMYILLYASIFMIIVGLICDVFILNHLFVTIVMLIWVIVFMTIFFIKLYLSKRGLKNIDLNILKNDINKGCVSFPKDRTYFTNNYVISNYYHAFVIKYSDICWMYPVNKYYNGIRIGTDLYLYTINRKEIIPFTDLYLQIINDNNSNILFGNTSENKKKYKDKKKQGN